MRYITTKKYQVCFYKKKKTPNNKILRYLATYQEKSKTTYNPIKNSLQKHSPSNKCTYAYDNLAYGFCNDIKQN